MVFQSHSLFILAVVLVWMPLTLLGRSTDSRRLLRRNLHSELGPIAVQDSPVPRFARSLVEVTAETAHEFKIVVDYSLSDPMPETTLKFLNDYAFTPVVDMYRQMVKVNGTGVLPAFEKTGCFDESLLPNKYKAGGVSGDIVIFVVAKTIDPAINAISDSCGLDPKTGRPVIGLITLNLANIRVNYNAIESIKSTIIHELNHILAFDIFLFDYFQSDKTSVYDREVSIENGERITYFQIKLPKIIEFSKKFFDCPEMESLPMEDEGSLPSRNSHFDKRIAGNEVMTAQREGRQIMSMFTLIFLASTGWYKVDFSFAEEFIYGKGQGCPTQKISKDNLTNISLANDQNRCSGNFMGKTDLIVSVFNSNQPQQIPLRKYRCSNTQNFAKTSPFEAPSSISRCFQTVVDKDNSSGCYPVICREGVPNVLVEDSAYVCKDPDDILVHKEVKIMCNNFDLVCKRPTCENDCNGNGVCLENGKCKCFMFFSGDSCENYSECDSTDTLCALLTPNTKNTWTMNQELISRFILKIDNSSDSRDSEEKIDPVIDKRENQSTEDFKTMTSSKGSTHSNKQPNTSDASSSVTQDNKVSNQNGGINSATVSTTQYRNQTGPTSQTTQSTPSPSSSNENSSELKPPNQTTELKTVLGNPASSSSNTASPTIQSNTSQSPQITTTSGDVPQSADGSRNINQNVPDTFSTEKTPASSENSEDNSQISNRDNVANTIGNQSNQQGKSACSILRVIILGLLAGITF
jgi:hypothetical protein